MLLDVLEPLEAGPKDLLKVKSLLLKEVDARVLLKVEHTEGGAVLGLNLAPDGLDLEGRALTEFLVLHFPDEFAHCLDND